MEHQLNSKNAVLIGMAIAATNREEDWDILFNSNTEFSKKILKGRTVKHVFTVYQKGLQDNYNPKDYTSKITNQLYYDHFTDRGKTISNDNIVTVSSYDRTYKIDNIVYCGRVNTMALFSEELFLVIMFEDYEEGIRIINASYLECINKIQGIRSEYSNDRTYKIEYNKYITMLRKFKKFKFNFQL